MQYSIIVPCYNEERNLPHCANRLLEALDRGLPQKSFEVIFVSDGSSDATLSLLQSLTHPAVKIETYAQNQGKGYAVRHGMLKARGEIRLFCDCDLAYGTDAVLQMLTKMKNDGLDLLLASRRKHADGYAGYSFGRKVLSFGYFCIIRLLTGLKASDSQSGLKAFSRDVAETVFPLCEVNRFAFDLEVLMLAQGLGCDIAEMPAKIIENSHTSIRMSDPFKMLGDVLRIKKRVRRILKAKRKS